MTSPGTPSPWDPGRLEPASVHIRGGRWTVAWPAPPDCRVDGGVAGRRVVHRTSGGTDSSAKDADWTRLAAVRLEQVHGSRVAVVTGPGPVAGADAAVTTVENLLLTVRVADCVPILLAAPGGIGVTHAGWRGTRDGIARRTVECLLRTTGDDAARVAAFLGPAIGRCCYEVGPEVAGAFDPRFCRPGGSGREMLDLVEANRAQLLEVGLPAGGISAARLCTRCHQHLLHSYRGSQGRAGRLDAFLYRPANRAASG